MASDAVKKHPWHMVNPSPWPFIGSVGAFIAAVGGIHYMHDGAPWVMIAGFAIVLTTMAGWWREVVREGESGADHSEPVRQGLRMGMLLFIASEVMFFFAFFWAYFNASIPAISGAASEMWPPEGVVPLETWHLPFLNTLILLTSGATVTWAHHAVRIGHRSQTIIGIGLTVLLGFIFLGFQAFEYGHAAFGFTDGIYPSTFYLATGFHGFHVFVGACFLAVCFFRAVAGHFKPEQHVGFEAAAWYWHFVDVVWLFLFVCIYWWGSSGYQG